MLKYHMTAFFLGFLLDLLLGDLAAASDPADRQSDRGT